MKTTGRRGAMGGLGTVQMVLCTFLGIMSLLAVMPFSYPGIQLEGATPPVDEGEARAAAERLMEAARALWFGSVVITHFHAESKAVAFLCVGALAYAAFRAVHIFGILAVWVAHVDGPLASYYHLGVGSPILLLLLFGAMHVLN